MFVDLLFPAVGESVPVDHAYPLYAALSRLVPAFHDPAARIRFAPLSGLRGEPGRLRLTDRSCLRVRLPADAIPTALPLAGKAVEVMGARVELHVPKVLPLVPAAILQSPLVTFRHADTVETFLKTGLEKLRGLKIEGKPAVRVFPDGPRVGQPRRRVVRIKERKVIGFAMVVSELTAAESICLQECGLGGRTQMGCGFFWPAQEGSQ